MAVLARFTEEHLEAHIEKQQAIRDLQTNVKNLGVRKSLAAPKRAPAKKKES